MRNVRMKNCNYKIGVFALIIASVSIVANAKAKAKIDCSIVSSVMEASKHFVEDEEEQNLSLEKQGFVLPHSIFGVRSHDQCVDDLIKHTKMHIHGAQTLKANYNMNPNDFDSIADQCYWQMDQHPRCIEERKLSTTVHEKYRSIDGRGNNAKNALWGASATPFSRFGPKNYEDGIYSIKKSVTGSDLPSARLIVQEVLSKAVKSPPPPPQATLNVIALLIILFATHDLHYQVPMQPKDADKEILCCSKDLDHVADNKSLNTACLPIEVYKEDSLYKDGNIGCLNMVRSQIGEFPDIAQTGEILNRATAYIDLSLIYGNHESELKEIRLYEKGKLRMGKNNLLPVDKNQNYLKSMDRFINVPIASIWPALFARNHNQLAGRLAKINPHWDDEKVFQEARRINIANLQLILIGSKAIEKVFGRAINESYSEARNAGTFVEFALTYRAAHYYMPSDTLFENENYETFKRIPHSDTIGKIELLENYFDSMLRAVSNQLVNTGQYSDEIINRIGKAKKDGYGIDLVATDIQRGRDHGVPSFVETRRKCKLDPEINSFDDFNLIFDKANVELLKKIYKSHEDVDLYVGGLLETFVHLANPLAGPTFGCIIGENYANAMGGDIYYYSHPENPYPMTKEQIAAIRNYQVNNLLCENSKLKETNKLWPLPVFPADPIKVRANPKNLIVNEKIDCKYFPPMDLTAWTERV